MQDLLSRYRESHSVDAENRAIDEVCAKDCQLQVADGVCKSTDPEIAPFFKGLAPYRGSVKAAFKPREDDYRCWRVLPKLSLASEPKNYISAAETEKLKRTPCFLCRSGERAKLQSEAIHYPDYRFWIGVGAAGTGVLLALTAALIRR